MTTRSLLSTRTAHVVAVLSVGAVPCVLLGCQPAALQPEPSATKTAAPSPPPVVLPDLSPLEAPVREQIIALHAAVRRHLDEGLDKTAPAELGESYGDLGSFLHLAGYREVAEAAYLNAHTLAPDVTRWAYYVAHYYRQLGDQDNAVAFFERTLVLDPSYAPAMTWLGEIYLDQGRPVEAAKMFQRGLDAVDKSARGRGTDTALALYGLGRAVLAQDDRTRAVELLERALELDPAATSIHYSLGLAHRALGNLDKAAEHLELRGSDDPLAPVIQDPLLAAQRGLLQSALAYESRGTQALNAGRYAEAAEIFTAAIQAAPNDAQLRHRLGAALMFGGDPDRAAREFHLALDLAPGFAPAHYSLGALASMNGQADEAIERYTAAVRHQPNYLEAHLGLADALRLTGRIEKSLPHFERVVEIDPSFADGWMANGVTLVLLERFVEASHLLQRALQVHPGHPDLTDLLARILAAAPDDQARNGQRALVLMQPRMADSQTIEMQETMAMVLAEVARFDEAIVWQRRAIAGAVDTGQSARARVMRSNLSLYERERPSRQPLEPLLR